MRTLKFFFKINALYFEFDHPKLKLALKNIFNEQEKNLGLIVD